MKCIMYNEIKKKRFKKKSKKINLCPSVEKKTEKQTHVEFLRNNYTEKNFTKRNIIMFTFF